jgi:hypothetical protein
MAADVESGPCEFEGFLKKKSPKGFGYKVWQLRYFKLYEDGLHYYKKKGDPAAGIISFYTITAIEVLSKKEGHRFNVRIGDEQNGRQFCFEANSQSECLDWVNSMNKLLRKFQNANRENNQSIAIPEKQEGKFWKFKLHKSLSKSAVMAQDEKIEQAAVPLRIQIVRQETEGPVGNVYRCKDTLKSSQLHYLLHAVWKDDPYYKAAKSLFKAMATLDHHNIIKQIHHGKTSDAIFTVYNPPFQARDSLLTYLTRHKRFGEDVVRFWSAEVASALGYLHKGGYSFRNLSPENIYLDTGGHAVVADFLLCSKPQDIPAECSLVEYTAPETLKGNDSTRSDWWRLGMLMYELAVGIPAIQEHNLDAMQAKLDKFDADNLQFPPFVRDELVSCVKELLIRDPKKRLGGGEGDYKELKAHPFFKAGGLNWKDFVAPTWVLDNVVNSMSPSHLKHFTTPVRYVNSLRMEVISARDLMSNGGLGWRECDNVYCEVRGEGRVENTVTIRGDLNPVWNSAFNFDILTAQEFLYESELEIQIVQELKNQVKKDADGNIIEEFTPLIGTVVLSLTDIQASHPDKLDLWHTVVSPHGMPCGELHATYQWKRTKFKGQPTVYQKFSEAGLLFDIFGQPPVMERHAEDGGSVASGGLCVWGKPVDAIDDQQPQPQNAQAVALSGGTKFMTRRRSTTFGSAGIRKPPPKLPALKKSVEDDESDEEACAPPRSSKPLKKAAESSDEDAPPPTTAKPSHASSLPEEASDDDGDVLIASDSDDGSTPTTGPCWKELPPAPLPSAPKPKVKASKAKDSDDETPPPTTPPQPRNSPPQLPQSKPPPLPQSPPPIPPPQTPPPHVQSPQDKQDKQDKPQVLPPPPRVIGSVKKRWPPAAND